VLRSPDLLLLTVGLVLIASIGKFSGAFVGGRFGGLTRAESLALACGMNARGSTEVIVASIGLSMNVLSQNLFTMIVSMAIVTTMAMPPMLRWALARLPLGKEEKQRLEREEIDARGFVVNIERLLLAVDESATGKFAGQLAGALAGVRRAGGAVKPITNLDMARDDRKKNGKAKAADKVDAPTAEAAEPAKAKPAAAKEDAKNAKPEAAADKAERNDSGGKTADAAAQREQEIKLAAEKSATAEQEVAETKPPSVDITTRPNTEKSPEAVAEEARKGYGFMVIGLDKTRAPKGGFSRDVTRIAEGFDGPLAVVVARGPQPAALFERRSRILIAVNGTDVSRRAAEVALALARTNKSQVTALYIARAGTPGGKRKGRPRGSTTRRNEEAVLKDFAALADRYDIEARTAIRVNVAPEEAVLREAKRGRYDLIVLGAGRRPGKTLSFGNTAAGVLDRAESSAIFVAS
jgi:nucleotide-binding universal stress UspA family protein